MANISKRNVGNKKRGFLISKSMARLERAIRGGFYLEAIALCDSLVTSRISAVGHYSLEKVQKFRGVNDALRGLAQSNVVMFDNELLTDTREWGLARNECMHGFVKLDDFGGHSWMFRLKRAKEVAKRGQEIVNRWLKEAKLHRI